jgi:tight adherence protein C
MSLFLSLFVDLAAFLLVVTGVFFAARRWETTQSVNRRLRGEASSDELKKKSRMPSTLVKRQEVKNPVLQWVQRTTLQDPEERNKLQRDLALAGFDFPAAPIFYVMTRFCLAVGLPTIFVFWQTLSAKPMQPGMMYYGIVAGCALVGLILPRAFLDNRVNARKTQIENEFPDALDLMVVCVEAGLGMEGAIVRVGDETVDSHPRISNEFQMVSHELRAGRTRAEALRHMADRTQVEMIGSFVALMIQTDALGGSIAQTLRTYSAEMREHRMLRAEEKAMRLPVLLTIPLVLFILPTMMGAVMIPPFIQAFHVFGPHGSMTQ